MKVYERGGKSLEILCMSHKGAYPSSVLQIDEPTLNAIDKLLTKQGETKYGLST